MHFKFRTLSTKLLCLVSIFSEEPRSPSAMCRHIRFSASTGFEPCKCTADFMGNPPARLQWLLDDVVVAEGMYGVKELEFPTTGQASANGTIQTPANIASQVL